MTARPFDLKAALSGEPVMIEGRDGSEGVLKVNTSAGAITTMQIGGSGAHFMLDGCAYSCGDTSREPLFRLVMAPRKVKRTVWVNLYDLCENANSVWYGYDDKETALKWADNLSDRKPFATAVPVEIEVAE